MLQTSSSDKSQDPKYLTHSETAIPFIPNPVTTNWRKSARVLCSVNRGGIRAIAAQPSREGLQRFDAARLSAPAPILELTDQLLLRRGGALPQRGEFISHRVHRCQHLARLDGLAALLVFAVRQSARVHVQPALERARVDI